MTLEIRPIIEEEREELSRIIRTGFNAGPTMNFTLPVDWTLCAFEDGKLTTSYGFYPLTILLNGAEVPIAAITLVGTLPIHRRHGYLRAVTTRHFQRLHETGKQHITALFASRTAIYQRYGYSVVSGNRSYSIAPRDIQLLHTPEIPGEFREAGEADDKTMLDIYHQYVSGRNGYLLRQGDYFKITGAPYATYQPPELADKLVKVIYSEGGKPLGYLAYAVLPNTPTTDQHNQALDINDMAWLSPSAYHAIWSYLAQFDLVTRITRPKVPPDDPLEYLLLEPQHLAITSCNGLLARIVDVEKAMPLRPYSSDGTLTFKIKDDLCDWNRGTWKLEASASGSTIGKTDESPQVSMPVSTLAMLVFGRITATEAARMGRLDVHDASALPLWDSVMRTEYAPFCPDMF